jgi:GrpB-like predicted nucleotidyltransferase (UPF0157 family)
MQLIPAELIRPAADQSIAVMRTQLKDLGVTGEVVLVGGSSVPGALTRGDIDLHLRVPPTDFDSVLGVLKEVFTVVHPEIWATTLAAFEVTDDPPVALAVTPAGSEHDVRFTRSWQLLAADPELVQEYNDVKQSATDAEYEARKSAFFDMLLARWPSHPAGGLSA